MCAAKRQRTKSNPIWTAIGTDCFTVEKRSEVMRAVRHENTAAELKLRRALWKQGLRYRIHQKVLGVRPDICLAGRRLVVFVDGCFWHGCPEHYTTPLQNADFWKAKLSKNVARDKQVIERLTTAGWKVVRVWECTINRDIDLAVSAVMRALET
jgi:DNA mismatch endonuclease, patch repair protein